MYDANFYDAIRAGSQSSAYVVMNYLYDNEIKRLDRVLDVGCGEGWWAYNACLRGISSYSVGMDNDGFESPDRAYLDDWVKSDITTNLSFVGDKFDFTICLEVAEHLPESKANELVRFLTDSSNGYILFSAAIPNQPGHGHVNCQWPSYWVEKFNAHGWWGDGSMRLDLWDNEAIEPWYRQNMILFDNFSGENLNCQSLVHPTIWGWK